MTVSALRSMKNSRFAGAGAPAAAAALIALFVVLAPIADVLGITSLVLSAAVVGVVAWRNPAARAPLLVAFAARAGASMLHAFVTPLPGSGMDAVGFERIGWEWSSSTWSELSQRFTSGFLLYSWIIAFLYWLTDRSPLMIQAVNVLFGTLVVFNVFRLSVLLWGEAVARRATWVAALFPTMVLYSALTMREIAVVYPLTLGAICLVRWRQSNNPLWALAAVVSFVCGISFHTVMVGAIAYTGVAVAARWVGSVVRGKLGSAIPVGIALVGVAAVGGFALATGIGSRINYFDLLESTEAIAGQQGGGVLDRTDYLRGMVMTSFTDLVWQLPIRTVFFLFMPFPWLVRAAVDLVGLVDAALYVWLSVCLWRSLRRVWAAPAARDVMLLWLSCMLVFALVVSNYGTAIRHRGKTAPLLIAAAAPALRGRRSAPVRAGSPAAEAGTT